MDTYFAVLEDPATGQRDIVECDVTQDPVAVAKSRGNLLIAICPSQKAAEETLAARLRKPTAPQ